MKNNSPDNITIQRYLRGELDKTRMHELEKQALNDPFLAEAMEGYSQVKSDSAGLSILQRQLHERISHLQENKKVFDLSWQRLSVATAAAVLFISAGILFWMNSQIAPKQSTQNEKRVDVSIVPVDSLSRESENFQTAATLAKADFEKATPTGGWDFYRNYVRKKIAGGASDFSEKGRVVVAFEVTSKSELRNFKIINGLSPVADSLAINLIRKGPKWRAAPNGQASEISIKIKF